MHDRNDGKPFNGWRFFKGAIMPARPCTFDLGRVTPRGRPGMSPAVLRTAIAAAAGVLAFVAGLAWMAGRV